MNALKVAFALPFVCLAALAANPEPSGSSLSCTIEKSNKQVQCDFQVPPNIEVKDVSLKVSGVATQIPAKGFTPYPAGQQTTAILFLIDTSDPRRKNTIEKKNVKAVTDMIGSAKSHQKIGVAVFDSEVRVIAPITSDLNAAKSAVATIKASGQSTEFYKSVLSAITILQKTDATRKALVIMSDGKSEDVAYKHEDALKAAKEAGVAILGLGYLEKSSESPYLQKIKRLAEESQGAYFEATDGQVPPLTSGKPFAFVEKGGRVSFDSGKYWGKQAIALDLRTNDGKTLDLKAEIEFPDNRARMEQFTDFTLMYWPILAAGFFLFVLLTWLLIRTLRKRALAARPQVAYAFMDELSGSGTRYPLVKTAVCIGRSEDNDIRLANDTISGHHAEIHRRREGDIYIVDLASGNGVYVNEARVERSQLNDGDVIELGEVRLRFVSK
jgi:hypothetical protein